MKLVNLHEGVYSSAKNLPGYPFDDKFIGDFICFDSDLTSLEEFPTEISGDFNCSNNELKSLTFSPQTITGFFSCSDNKITSLEGCPKIVGEWFNCSFNRITSLVGVDDFIERIGDVFIIKANPVIEGGIGLLLIKNLKHVKSELYALDIIDSFIGKPELIYDCQTMLIEKGFEAFAQL